MKKPPVYEQEAARALTMFSALTNNHHQKLHAPKCSLDLAELLVHLHAAHVRLTIRKDAPMPYQAWTSSDVRSEEAVSPRLDRRLRIGGDL
jgi:hypothetical protein